MKDPEMSTLRLRKSRVKRSRELEEGESCKVDVGRDRFVATMF